MAVWTVKAAWDAEADVWFAADSDIPGLAADAATIELLAEKSAAMLPDLLQIHASDLAGSVQPPHSIHVIAFHEVNLPVAA